MPGTNTIIENPETIRDKRLTVEWVREREKKEEKERERERGEGEERERKGDRTEWPRPIG